MNDELLNALDDCLSAIIAGESVDASLARYPALAADLRPLLEAALAAQQLSAEVTVPRLTQNASRAQFLARAAELRSPAPRRSFLAALNLNPRLLVNALGLRVVFALGAYSVAAVAAQSLPGEALYSLKRSVEQTQLALTVDPQARVQLQAQFAARRVEEARTVLAAGRVTNLEFEGVIDELNGERWTVAGLTVIVPAEASVTGVPFPGLFVEVQGQTQTDGAVRATTIRVTGLVFRGIVNLVGAESWQIDEQGVVINSQTQFVGAIGLGDEVDVSARPLSDDRLLALRITRVEGQVPPTATPTLAPTTAATLAPSATPAHTASATATRTASLTLMATPTHTPSPTRTRLLTSTPTPSGVELPSSTPSPVPSEPTRLLEPTQTPEPTHPPELTETPEPSETEFDGTVTAINGNLWTIGEHLVTVTDETEYEGNPGVGSFVDVNAWQYPDGTLVARRIRVR